MPATPFLAPSYFTPSFFPRLFFGGGPVVPPAAGNIAVSSAGGVDTITYAAPAAGDNPVASTALFAGTRPSGESPTAVATRSGAGGGSFARPSADPGGTNYYYVRAVDVLGLASAPSNEVGAATARDTGPAASPVAGTFAEALLMTPTAPTSAAGAVVGTFWAYFPAAGDYAVAVVGGELTVRATGLTTADLIVAVPAAGLYTVTVARRRSGHVVAAVAPFMPGT